MINSISLQNQNGKLPFSYIHIVGFNIDGCTSLSALLEEVILHDLTGLSDFKINSAVGQVFQQDEQRQKGVAMMYLCAYDSSNIFYYFFGRQKISLQPLLSYSCFGQSLFPEPWQNLPLELFVEVVSGSLCQPCERLVQSHTARVCGQLYLQKRQSTSYTGKPFLSQATSVSLRIFLLICCCMVYQFLTLNATFSLMK